MRKWVDWMPHLTYWVEGGKPDPKVDFPSDWEVCGFPPPDPFARSSNEKRPGHTTLAMPMYRVEEPIRELEHVCSFLERMPVDELTNWLSLQDRYISLSFADPEVHAANLETVGLHIPGPLLRRLGALRLRTMFGFHPRAEVILNYFY
jgi:hypothetical protein